MIAILVVLILVGLFVGRIRIFGVRIGLAGVLILSLLFGVLSKNYTILFDGSMVSTCDFLSSFGTALFISVIGIESGKTFTKGMGKKQWKAFFGGMIVIGIGAIVLVCCGILDSTIQRDLLMGLFSGSMTSTPAMSAALEKYSAESSVAIGYGISYWIGLLSIVLFVQLFRLPYASSNDRKAKSKPLSSAVDQMTQTDSLMIVFVVILIGLTLSMLLPIGNTGGILVSGLLLGFICYKKCKCISDLTSYKTLGLILFFIGNGITAGTQLNVRISWHYILYGAMIPIFAIGLGYLLIHFVLSFSKSDTLAILCGGMTSTPAIGVLQDRDRDTDLSLYATSYVGALITLLTIMQIIPRIWT